jgi:hypothetical protein
MTKHFFNAPETSGSESGFLHGFDSLLGTGCASMCHYPDYISHAADVASADLPTALFSPDS